MGIIISVINAKGGIGKTAATVNLAHALANRGNKVLVGDLDSQSNSTKLLLGPDVETNTLYDLLAGDISAEQAIYSTKYDNLFCLPNIPATAGLEIDLYENIKESYLFLRKNLRAYATENYDFTIIDNSPALGVWSYMSMIASDWVIIPVEAGSRFSIDGLLSALEHIEAIRTTLNPDLRFLRLLINKVDQRTTISKASVEQIRKKFGKALVFDTTIPINTDFHQAEEFGLTLIRHNPRSAGAKKYRELAAEVMKVLQG